VAVSDNGVIAQAETYTVGIRASITAPFIEDTNRAISGAGFIVSKDPLWVMTNAHVVGHSGLNKIRVSLDGEVFSAAEAIYIDPHLDLAVLRLSDPVGLEGARKAPLNCEGLPEVGEAVAAFGHPKGYRNTASRGIISGTTVELGKHWLQTDAPLNSGNSGGPLLNLETGQVIGVNAAQAGGDYENLNFAVPMKYACRVLELMKGDQEPGPPQLPFRFVSDGGGDGVIVAKVLDPDVSGVRVGDRILGMRGKAPVTNVTQLLHQLRGHQGQVELKVRRGDKELSQSVAVAPPTRVVERRAVKVAGLIIAPMGVKAGKYSDNPVGLMVQAVEPTSWAGSAGLRAWDFLVRVDGKPIKDLRAFYRHLQSRKEAGKETILIIRRLSQGYENFHGYHRYRIPIAGLAWLAP
jgi:S1-C subfamily serine protease